MKNKLFEFGSRVVKYLFYFLFLMTFYFALTSPNLIVGDNSVTGAGTTKYTTLFIILMIAFLISFYTYNSFADLLRYLFIDRGLLTSSVIFGLVIIWQIIFVVNVHPAIGFDAGALHKALFNVTDPEMKGYYSVNPNNIPPMLLQHQLAVIFHNRSWLFFDFITMLMVDISAILNFGSVWVLDHKKLPMAIYLHNIWLAVFPMIIVPYTDTWALPFVSLYMMLYCLVRYGKFKWGWKIPLAALMGVAVIFAYFIKPSSIIGAIAILLIEILYLFKEKFSAGKLINEFIFVLVVVIAMVPTYGITNYAINHQKYMEVNTARAIPPIHFISIGMEGDGGYNAHDVLMMGKLPTKQARVDYSKKKIKRRLHSLGFFGYLKFLVGKQSRNTADGTFAWIKEGHFIQGETNPSSKGFQGKLRNFVYLYGKFLGDFRYIAQIVWVILLATIVLNWHDNRKIIQTLRLAIIGGFLFILIFEGGRSRYLIQFLPSILILAALSASNSWNWLCQKLAWVNHEP